MAIPKRTERSRTLILDAADEAFREKGFAATSVEEIAMMAGLTRKTVYNLFASKDEIASQLIARVEANDAPYRDRIEAGGDVFPLLESVLLDSARWCLANPSLAKLALAPVERPSLKPPPDRPSFQRLVRDIMVLGQRQGVIRQDDDPNFLALVLLGVYGQAMLSVLAGGEFTDDEIIPIVAEADSWDSQKRTNLNLWRKQEVCDGFSAFFAVGFRRVHVAAASSSDTRCRSGAAASVARIDL